MKYAKLAAERARNWLRSIEFSDSASEISSINPEEGAKDELIEAYNKILDVNKIENFNFETRKMETFDNPLKRQFFFC